MPRANLPIISREAPAAGRRAARLMVGSAAIIGAIAAWHFARLGLTLSHVDARAHLVVARRVIDSLTPGWRQLGGLWLPLPHLLNLLPICWDWNYRTGASAVVISVLSCAGGLAALARYFHRLTGSLGVSLAMPLAILMNPNVLYLQSTPMTEPLLFGAALLSLAAVDDWIAQPTPQATRRAGWLLAALVLTRYEGWFIAGGLVAVGAAASRLRGARAALAPALYPAIAMAAFLVLSRASTGSWLVTSGFFVANNPALGHPAAALREIASDTAAMASPILLMAAAVGLGVCLLRVRRSKFASLLPVTMLGAAVLPLIAFQAGHPERARYMAPLVVACGALAGVVFAIVPARFRSAVAVALLTVIVMQRPPLAANAPMLLEALYEQPERDARRAITATLASSYDDSGILASMSSLGQYMQESADAGLRIRDFVHEGNGDLWQDALRSPRRHVGWILIEERVGGGDALAARAREDPAFLSGFSRVAAAGGVALYRSQNLTRNPKLTWVPPRSILSLRKPLSMPPVSPEPN